MININTYTNNFAYFILNRLKTLLEYINDFLNLFYPETCSVCNNSLYKYEKIICTECIYKIPKTKYHTSPNNPIYELFIGRVNIQAATALMFFSKGSIYNNMIQNLKYKGKKKIGYEMGLILANEIKDTHPYNKVDIILPIPLHKNREKKRGYNQSEWIAKGLSEILKIPIDTLSIYRNVNTKTQTKKTKEERWDNVESIFSIKKTDNLVNKHILIVDDIITTGSTIESCSHTVLSIPNTKVSIVTIGVASS